MRSFLEDAPGLARDSLNELSKRRLKNLIMKDLNRVSLLGRLGVDPQLKKTKDGESRCTFTVATKRGEETQWHNIVVWGEQADLCEKSIQKGNRVLIDGEIRARKYAGSDGIARTWFEIRANDVRFIDRRPKDTKGEVEVLEAEVLEVV
jgi:single-strand DNA-binding protein